MNETNTHDDSSGPSIPRLLGDALLTRAAWTERHDFRTKRTDSFVSLANGSGRHLLTAQILLSEQISSVLACTTGVPCREKRMSRPESLTRQKIRIHPEGHCRYEWFLRAPARLSRATTRSRAFDRAEMTASASAGSAERNLPRPRIEVCLAPYGSGSGLAFPGVADK